MLFGFEITFYEEKKVMKYLASCLVYFFLSLQASSSFTSDSADTAAAISCVSNVHGSL